MSRSLGNGDWSNLHGVSHCAKKANELRSICHHPSWTILEHLFSRSANHLLLPIASCLNRRCHGAHHLAGKILQITVPEWSENMPSISPAWGGRTCRMPIWYNRCSNKNTAKFLVTPASRTAGHGHPRCYHLCTLGASSIDTSGFLDTGHIGHLQNRANSLWSQPEPDGPHRQSPASGSTGLPFRIKTSENRRIRLFHNLRRMLLVKWRAGTKRLWVHHASDRTRKSVCLKNKV